MKDRKYDRKKAIDYANEWSYRRNPRFYNFDNIGGDCTNFVSQCIYAGSEIMNYNKYGWYYNNGNDKSASWTGVEYLYKFLTTNRGVGPCGREVLLEEVQIGDIAQLSFDGEKFSHSLLIVETNEKKSIDNTLVATHTFDSYGRKIASYSYVKIRYIHIEKIRIY